MKIKIHECDFYGSDTDKAWRQDLMKLPVGRSRI